MTARHLPRRPDGRRRGAAARTACRRFGHARADRRCYGGGSAANTAAWLVRRRAAVRRSSGGSATTCSAVARGRPRRGGCRPRGGRRSRTRPPEPASCSSTPTASGRWCPSAGANAALGEADLPAELFGPEAQLHVSGYALFTRGLAAGRSATRLPARGPAAARSRSTRRRRRRCAVARCATFLAGSAPRCCCSRTGTRRALLTGADDDTTAARESRSSAAARRSSSAAPTERCGPTAPQWSIVRGGRDGRASTPPARVTPSPPACWRRAPLGVTSPNPCAPGTPWPRRAIAATRRPAVARLIRAVTIGGTSGPCRST